MDVGTGDGQGAFREALALEAKVLFRPKGAPWPPEGDQTIELYRKALAAGLPLEDQVVEIGRAS